MDVSNLILPTERIACQLFKLWSRSTNLILGLRKNSCRITTLRSVLQTHLRHPKSAESGKNNSCRHEYFSVSGVTSQHERSPLLQRTQRVDLQGRAVENNVLLAIPEEEYQALCPSLEFVALAMHEVVQEPGHPIEFGYFLNCGLISLLVVTSDAKSVEVGMVGKEAFLSAPLALGLRHSPQRAVVQVPSEGFRVRSKAWQEFLPFTPRLHQLLCRYLLVQGMHIAQVAACNRLHEIEQRLARWLLMSHDRIAADAFPVTHHLLAQMLGSGRPSVTVAAGALQRAGIIEYSRGMVRILNRKALENAACECYQAILRISMNNGTG